MQYDDEISREAILDGYAQLEGGFSFEVSIFDSPLRVLEYEGSVETDGGGTIRGELRAAGAGTDIAWTAEGGDYELDLGQFPTIEMFDVEGSTLIPTTRLRATTQGLIAAVSGMALGLTDLSGVPAVSPMRILDDGVQAVLVSTGSEALFSADGYPMQLGELLRDGSSELRISGPQVRFDHRLDD